MQGLPNTHSSLDLLQCHCTSGLTSLRPDQLSEIVFLKYALVSLLDWPRVAALHCDLPRGLDHIRR